MVQPDLNLYVSLAYTFSYDYHLLGIILSWIMLIRLDGVDSERLRPQTHVLTKVWVEVSRKKSMLEGQSGSQI